MFFPSCMYSLYIIPFSRTCCILSARSPRTRIGSNSVNEPKYLTPYTRVFPKLAVAQLVSTSHILFETRHIYKNLQLDHILSQMNPLYILTT